jgi:flagellin
VGKDACPKQNDKEINIMRIQHNIMAMNAYRNYNNNTSALSSNLEKLSSGYKINRAGDDAAGLAISEKMRAQISGLEQASSNVKDGISLVKTGEGALQEVQDMLNRMVTLATQSANGTYDDDTDRAALQDEVDALKTEIDRIADSANFNGLSLLDGSLGGAGVDKVTGATSNGITSVSITGGDTTASITSAFTLKLASNGALTFTGKASGVNWTTTGTITSKGGSKTYVASVKSTCKYSIAKKYAGMKVTVYVDAANSKGKWTSFASATCAITPSQGLDLQIGDTADDFNKLKVEIGDMHVSSLGIEGLSVASQNGAATAIDSIKKAINSVSSTRGKLGAVQNRLEHTSNNLSVMTENIQDAESTIRDTDVAEEMMSYTKNNILVQSAQAMLAQANSVPQGVLQLLQ